MAVRGHRGARVRWSRCSPPIVLVLIVFRIGANAHSFPGGFILSPSATLRVAGLPRRVKVEHPLSDPPSPGALESGQALSGRWREERPQSQPGTDGGCSCTSRSILEPDASPEAKEAALLPRAIHGANPS